MFLKPYFRTDYLPRRKGWKRQSHHQTYVPFLIYWVRKQAFVFDSYPLYGYFKLNSPLSSVYFTAEDLGSISVRSQNVPIQKPIWRAGTNGETKYLNVGLLLKKTTWPCMSKYTKSLCLLLTEHGTKFSKNYSLYIATSNCSKFQSQNST